MGVNDLKQRFGTTASEKAVVAFPNMIEQLKKQVALALPKHLNADRMARIALSAFRQNPDLQKCEPTSIFASVIVASQLGLEPNILGQGYLVPYNNKKKGIKECQFIPGWQGLVDLVQRSGRASVWTGAVFKGDEFDYSYGSNPFITHKPGGEDDPDLLQYVYACGQVKGSERTIIEVWKWEKVEKHRDRYNRVGDRHYSYEHPEMYARKVVLLQVLKYMPKSVELSAAIGMENAANTGESQYDFKDALEGDFVANASTETDEGSPAGGQDSGASTGTTSSDKDTPDMPDTGKPQASDAAKPEEGLPPAVRAEADVIADVKKAIALEQLDALEKERQRGGQAYTIHLEAAIKDRLETLLQERERQGDVRAAYKRARGSEALMDYAQFLADKASVVPPTGLTKLPALSSDLFPFQRDIVEWALRRGRAAVFADCGMGKTLMQLEWARHIPGNVLVLAPLAVAKQTVEEGVKFGIEVNYCRSDGERMPGITITNYEMLEHFNADAFTGIVLDESSILKSYDGKTRTRIIESFLKTPYRLACTATPAPNDYMELGNHSEFLGVMSRVEMLSMFFTHDGGETQKWRLKGHATQDYWRWLASWAVMIRKPSDLGYPDGGFTLPPLRLHDHVLQLNRPTEGQLFATEAITLQERIAARRDSVAERVAECAALVNASHDPWVVWCNLNTESQALAKAIPDAVEITGADSVEKKEAALEAFASGKARVIVSKPSICGWGLNWQHCAHMAFVGLSDSWEAFYQAIRRCYRFGQRREVNAHLIVADSEGAVLRNIQAKESAAAEMAEYLVAHMRTEMQHNVKGTQRVQNDYERDVAKGENWICHLGDCVEVVKDMPTDSVHYTVFSPPFASLYTYSASDRDMGNCADAAEFMAHFAYLVKDLYRVTMPGRLLSFHCMNLPTSKVNHGYIGIRDFRGELIRLFESEGFIYHSEVCIWKDPVTAMQRTKALGLLYKQLKKDSAMSRQGIPDYLVTMRKPGENPERVTKTEDGFPVGVWQRYASPVWMDINPSDTLQFRSAREHDDERHICPLQLGVIRRAIELWSNPGDTVLSPFAGIGSEGHVALQLGRKFVGAELKRSYWAQACANLKQARTVMGDMFTVDQESA